MALRVLTALAVCLAAGFAGVAEDKPQGDAALLQGTWDWDPAAKQSDAQPQVLLERVVVRGDTLTFHYSLDGRKSTSATKFTLDPAASPKTIDFAPTEEGNANKGKAYLGLYEIKGGKLRFCYRGPESTRPKSFTDKQDGTNGTQFVALKPAKAK